MAIPIPTDRVEVRNRPLERGFNACLLRPSDFASSGPEFEVIGAFNPGVVQTENGIVLLVRVAEQPVERRRGFVGLPRWDPQSQRPVIDWTPQDEVAPVDVRVVRQKRDGLVRLTFISHLRVLYSRDGRTIEGQSGVHLEPGNALEEFGVEDPRITRIGDAYYVTYVAVSRHGVATALASTRDFKQFDRRGLIFCPENKDVALFPERIGGAYYALHRPNGATPFTKPEIWIASSPDLLHWGQHERLLSGGEAWDLGRIGGGAPPIRTKLGWLEIYHGNSKGEAEKNVGTYSGGLLLLEGENPRRVLGRRGQVFVPETDFEREGFVPNVVFPTGVVQNGDKLLVFYGAADTFVGIVEFSLDEILHRVRPQ
ncbi:MAG: glycoside hydrolase family 130 protein [Verrucomicrobia subdivision 3 bacterium]|nr:glycoside hydrolase family 130 protein [Limisphaerales bacterium]